MHLKLHLHFSWHFSDMSCLARPDILDTFHSHFDLHWILWHFIFLQLQPPASRTVTFFFRRMDTFFFVTFHVTHLTFQNAALVTFSFSRIFIFSIVLHRCSAGSHYCFVHVGLCDARSCLINLKIFHFSETPHHWFSVAGGGFIILKQGEKQPDIQISLLEENSPSCDCNFT